MGDRNAVDIGQAFHEGLLRPAGVLDDTALLQYGKPLPSSKVLMGVYINDFCVLSKVPRHDPYKPGPDTEIMHKAKLAYEDAQFEPAHDKEFLHSLNAKVWGGQVRGEQGRIGGPLKSRRELAVVLSQLLTVGAVFKSALQQILGIVVSLFVYRRELLASLHSITFFRTACQTISG